MEPESKEEFMHPYKNFHGEFSPENLVLDANLQEFASKTSIICSLENGGKLSPTEAYDQIKELWHQVENSRKVLFE